LALILGIDPGLANTGWGLVERAGSAFRCAGYGAITTEPEEELPLRLLAIARGVRAVFQKWNPAACAVESLYFGRNVTSAISVAEARGVVLALAAEAGVPVYSVKPNDIKKSVTGVTRADKMQVQEMTRLLLGLAEIPKPDHAADALAAAICIINSGRL
jgi:crossover junction endodeoxyribonuclease RuvC